jgi:CMP-N,N'-diacetyllegionaminic acid synthase
VFRGKPVLAVIPARGGSKGLPGKNLLKLGGLSMIERAAKAAFDSGVVDMVVVSSDDDEILKHANAIGEVVAHRRNELAANDTATAGDVIRDLFDSDREDVFISEDNAPWFVYLQPTSPLRTAKHILSAFEKLVEHPDSNAIVSVAPLEPKVYWTMKIGDAGVLEPLFPEAVSANRQSFEPVYRPNGAIYIFSYEEFKKTGKFPIMGALPFVMSVEESVDIDTQADFDEAKRLLND